MSDFLGHLVARSLELAPVVQPRLASLFEPVAGAAVPEPALESTNSTEAAPSPAERGRAGEGVLREDPSPALPRADAREREIPLPPPERARSVRRRVEPPPPPETAPPAVAADPAPLLPAPVRPVPARSLEARVEEPERKSRPAESRREDPPAIRPLLPRIEIPRLPEPRPAPGTEAAADPPRREVVRTAEPALPPAPAPAPRGIVVQPRIERAPAAPPPAPPVPEAPAPAPTIHVTIGRIEVRATNPQTPAAPARRASAPAVMTLDEYLRRRDGERR